MMCYFIELCYFLCNEYLQIDDFRGLVSSAWAQVNIKYHFLTPKMSTPVKPGSALHLFVTFEEKQDQTQHPKVPWWAPHGPKGKCQQSALPLFRSDQKYQDHTNLYPNKIVSLIFVIACQTNTWTSDFVFRGLKPNIIFVAPSPRYFSCLIQSCDLRTFFLFVIYFQSNHIT